MPKLRNGSKGDANPGFLDCESDILPLSYRAPKSLDRVAMSITDFCLFYCRKDTVLSSDLFIV